MKQDNKELFSEFERCTKVKISLNVKGKNSSIFRPKLPVPFPAIDTVNKKLDRRINLGIISPANVSSRTMNVVIVKFLEFTIMC